MSVSEKLQALLRKRASIKARLKSFQEHVERIFTHESLDDLTVIELENRHQRVENLFSEYDRCHDEIACLKTEDELQELEHDRDEFERLFYNVTAKSRKLIDQTRVLVIEQASSSHSLPPENVDGGSHQGLTTRVKLPTLKLPEFDGSYENWLSFYDTFKSVIHSNEEISAVQKFHYLSGVLVGEAKRVIQGLEISAANYYSAWELLERRYQNKALMVHNHIKGIVEYPKMLKQSFSALRGLLNTIQRHTRALEALGQSVSDWNSLLIFIITDKFSTKLKTEWEKQQVEVEDLPSFGSLMEFMERQCKILEKLDKSIQETDRNAPRNSFRQVGSQSRNTNLSHATTNQTSCPICSGQHALFLCKSFLELPVESRLQKVRQHKRCLNCLRSGHGVAKCKARGCRKCQKSHNTLLHFERPVEQNSEPGPEEHSSGSSENIPQSVASHVGNDSCSSMVSILPTAVVQILDSSGNLHDCVALLDSCSQSNFLSTSLARKLKLPTFKVDINVSGVNQVRSNVSEMTKATIQSKFGSLKTNLGFLLAQNVTSILPSELIDFNKLRLPNNITLADPQFYKPKHIDMLIGVDLFWDLLCPESPPHPLLHKTRLGYVVSGKIPHRVQTKGSRVCNLATDFPVISHQLQQFWKVEEVPRLEKFSPEERDCELHFKEHTRRDADGRFIVSIPLKGSLDGLGDSCGQAELRFNSLERKLQRNKALKDKYTEFMQQYEKLGHMAKVHESEPPAHTYYLPHHGVLKEDSLTTKLRVVFDGSAPSSTGISINDLQMVGPTIQQDLLSIILRFRLHTYVVGADVSMMYRQVLIEPEQRSLQRILWRESDAGPLQTYELNTVTYGLASSSYLAIRCLMQLADENETSFPAAAEVIRKCMYVDDLLFGANTIAEARQICNDVDHILQSGQFQLRKWISNSPEIINQSNNSEQNVPCYTLEIGENETIKTLGLSWSSSNDNLIYKVDVNVNTDSCSKRSILSVIARIFDPLELLSPSIIIAKIILQRLWLEKSSWDEALSPELSHDWKKFLDDFSLITKLQIPRQVCVSLPRVAEIHAFSDASESAYGACVYIRSFDQAMNVSAKLLCAKSKVAPLKPMTIPRLELCAALISAKLVEKVKTSLDIQIDNIYYWCDSTITLCWLKIEPHKLKTFVSNRVSEIQDLSNPCDWHYVSSAENPADLLSRGVNPKFLSDSTLWWEGPQWLSTSDLKFHKDFEKPDLPETKPAQKTAAVSLAHDPIIPFEKYSDFNKLVRILAYCLRFVNNCRRSAVKQHCKFITTNEMHDSTIHLVKLVQRKPFYTEINCLSNDRSIPTKSKILSLKPFMHTDGTLRVGGRLRQSNYDFDKRHPIILPSNHHFTKLLFAKEHQRLLHAGPQNLLCCIREKYWPISGRNLARKTVHDCVQCFKANPKTLAPMMGDLPRDRVTPAPAFSKTGVDYAGPFLIKDRKGRGCKVSKCYVSVFICFVTRAIHLELVSDLTTECFILALRRFASRWGMPSRIYSDNGTNFVGARSELKELGEFLQGNQDCLSERFAIEHCDWRFIPAYSPHFGGIWEAGVRSVKHHLKRVMKNASLTFEEFYSLLAQIEAILNSRPLTPLSSDPSDCHALTPSHLLIGRSLTTVPDPDVTHIQESRLSRYQRIQQIQQHFWKRWAKEYLADLQCRTKWKTSQGNLVEGALVVVKDDNSPPANWTLARVTAVHPGPDSVVRVVSLRTSKGKLMNTTVTRLCPLPIQT